MFLYTKYTAGAVEISQTKSKNFSRVVAILDWMFLSLLSTSCPLVQKDFLDPSLSLCTLMKELQGVFSGRARPLQVRWEVAHTIKMFTDGVCIFSSVFFFSEHCVAVALRLRSC